MKKLLAILVLGLLLSGNAYAGWFSKKLPTLKCTLYPTGSNSFIKFYNLEDDYKKFKKNKSFGDAIVYEPTERYYKFENHEKTRGWNYVLRYKVDRYSGEFYSTISINWKDGDPDYMRKALTVREKDGVMTGVCEVAK